MEPKLIKTEDFVHFGEGFNGESFYLKEDPNVMLKLNFPFVARENAEKELDNARKVYDAGIPSPEPGEFVTDGNGRYGIMFRRIVDKISYARAVGDDPSRVEEYARNFAALCKKLHSTHLKTSEFKNQKTVYLQMLETNKWFKPEEKVKVAALINSVPDADTAIHGDLHYGNAIMSGGKDYFIDLGEFCYGHPYFDLGMVLLCTIYDTPEFIEENFHMSADTAKKFWHWFVKGYFGEDADPAEWDKKLRPFAGLKVLLIEYLNPDVYFEAFHKLLEI